MKPARICRSVAIIALLASGWTASADVGAPVEIKLETNTTPAVAGQEYSGTWVVRVFRAGTLTNFELFGDGWTIVAFDRPATPALVAPGVIHIPFRAIPGDADQPIGLRFKFDRRAAQRSQRVGPAVFAKRATPRKLARIAGSGDAPPSRDDRDDSAPPSGPRPRGGSVVVSGRVVYNRPGFDRSDPPDGDFNDPEDSPPMLVGADEIPVSVLDVDPLDVEEMWFGTTDALGYFVTPPLDADVDTDGSGPDLQLAVGALRDEWGGVFDPDGDWYYVWYGGEIEDFEGSEINFGNQMPLDPADHPAIHIYNSVIRAHRFIVEKSGYATPFVRVDWPMDHWSEYHADDQRIHLFSEHSWEESTVVHEYGHHFMNSLHETPPPDYDNSICDEGTPEGDCFQDGGTFPPGTGHCGWCRETDHDAWNEGFPDWLADVVPREFPTRYTLDIGGPPYEAAFAGNAESVITCCVDGMMHDPHLTEGFVAALLRDVEDAEQDDQDGDGIRDLLCVGAGPVLGEMITRLPITVSDFINGFRTDFPQHTADFRATAFNVGGDAYVGGFPADVQPPGVVTVCSSPSHPPGVGGPLPCITMEWDPAPDDATGACFYSYEFTRDPAGEEPDEVPNSVGGTDDCKLTATRGPAGLGDHYFSIKACDSAGQWSSEWNTFGPMTVTDCNGNGMVDLCDIDCPSAGIPGVCTPPGLCLFAPDVDCGLSSDCNGNYVPDECDIASGRSEDCNEDGIPDECETATLKHWLGGRDSLHPSWWSAGANWEEGQAPAAGNDVCVPASGLTPVLVTTNPTMNKLACRGNLSLLPAPGMGGVVLTLQAPSFIDGDLTMGSFPYYPRLIVNNELTVHGALNWSHGALGGTGQTTVLGSNSITGTVGLVDHTLNLQCDTLVSGGVILGTGSFGTIRNFPGKTYTQAEGIVHQGNGMVFVNEGTIVKPSGSGVTRLDSAVNNSGVIRCEAGSMRFGAGLISSGDIIGFPGTTLEFNGSHDLGVGSSVVGDAILFQASTPPDSRHVRGAYDAGAGTTISAGANVTFHPGAAVVDYGDQLIVGSASVGHFDAVVGSPIHFQSISSTGSAYFASGDPIVTQTLSVGPGSVRGANKDITVTGLLSWNNGGSFLDSGVIRANGGMTIAPGGTQKSLQCDLRNAATATVNGAFDVATGRQVQNLASGLWDMQVDGTLISGVVVFDNAGTLRKSAGAGTTTLGTGSPIFRSTFTNSGTVEVQTGTLAISWGSYTQSAGQMLLNGGNFSMTGSPAMPLQLDGGALRGAGTVTAVVNNVAAVVEPGNSAGTLNITGSYNQSAGGALRVEIGGTGAGQSDVLSVSGAATLAGELNVQTIGGFIPVTGNTFVVLSASSISGTFGSVTGAAGFTVGYTPTQVILTASGPQLPGDLDGDCDVDLSDLATQLGNYGTPSGATRQMGDVDGDGDVDLSDLATLLGSYGSTC